MNACSSSTVIWAAQLRLTDNAWFDEPLAAGCDGADPVDGVDGEEGVEGAAHVPGAEEAGDPAGLVAGPEDAGHVAGPGDFAWCPGLDAEPRVFVFDRIAGGIDAFAVVMGASADGVPPDGLAAAAGRAEPFRLAGLL